MIHSQLANHSDPDTDIMTTHAIVMESANILFPDMLYQTALSITLSILLFLFCELHYNNRHMENLSSVLINAASVK